MLKCYGKRLGIIKGTWNFRAGENLVLEVRKPESKSSEPQSSGLSLFLFCFVLFFLSIKICNYTFFRFYKSRSFLGFFFCLFFLDRKVGFIDEHSRGDTDNALMVQGPPFVQRAVIRDVFDPTAIRVSGFSATIFSNSSAFNLVNPYFLEMWIFWQPGNLNLALCSASVTCSLFCSLVRMDITTWPMWTLATVLWAFQRHRPYLSGA